MAGRTLTYFASDVHLGLDVKDPAAREARFVAFLKAIPADRTDALYLLGDIWDFWYEYRDVVPKGYVRVFSALMDLMDAGVRVYFFPGNHDIWCYSYFEEMGMEILSQPYSVEIGGKVFCLGHGDGLGPGQKAYKLMRWGFHNRVGQWLFSLLHPWLAFRLGKGWSKNSRFAKNEEYVFRGQEEPLWQFAEAFASGPADSPKSPAGSPSPSAESLSAGGHKVDEFIFGHYHCKVDTILPCGAGFHILKDWMDGSDALVFDSESGSLSRC